MVYLIPCQVRPRDVLLDLVIGDRVVKVKGTERRAMCEGRNENSESCRQNPSNAGASGVQDPRRLSPTASGTIESMIGSRFVVCQTILPILERYAAALSSHQRKGASRSGTADPLEPWPKCHTLGEPCPGFVAEPGKCWRMIYSHQLQGPIAARIRRGRVGGSASR